MIFIQSTRYDTTTDRVIDWLICYKLPFIRINEDNSITEYALRLEKGNTRLKVCFTNWHTGQKVHVDFNEITVYWYRRGHFSFQSPTIPIKSPELVDKDFIRDVDRYTKEERDYLLDLIYKHLDSLPRIGSFSENQINKLQSCRMAILANLNVPPTAIVSTLAQAITFLSAHPKAITKGIGRNGFSTPQGVKVESLTQIVSLEYVHDLPEVFAPSLLQQYIEKSYELRIFYLDGVVQSAAIFSQGDPLTQVDFRCYNARKPNRIVPFALPEHVTENIRTFMLSMQLNSGSIDMIKTPDNEYYFLEVNPIGQFSFISEAGNLYLEREVAHNLKCKYERSLQRISIQE